MYPYKHIKNQTPIVTHSHDDVNLHYTFNIKAIMSVNKQKIHIFINLTVFAIYLALYQNLF